MTIPASISTETQSPSVQVSMLSMQLDERPFSTDGWPQAYCGCHREEPLASVQACLYCLSSAVEGTAV